MDERANDGGYPYAGQSPAFDPAALARGIYMAAPGDLDAYAHAERDPRRGGRAVPVYRWALFVVAPGAGYEEHDRDPQGPTAGEDEYLDALCRSFRAVGWRSPLLLSPDRASPHGYALKEGNHRLAAARRLGVKVPVAVGYGVMAGDAENDWLFGDNMHGDLPVAACGFGGPPAEPAGVDQP